MIIIKELGANFKTDKDFIRLRLNTPSARGLLWRVTFPLDPFYRAGYLELKYCLPPGILIFAISG